MRRGGDIGWDIMHQRHLIKKLQVIIPLLTVIALLVLAHFFRTSFIPAYKRYSSYKKLVKGSVEVGDEPVHT